jgi:glycosyltransferase involved in cell wall biosynthesis
MSKKNLLFVGPWPPPFGGISSHLYELLPSISNKGYNVFVLSYSESKFESSKIERGVKIFYFSPLIFFRINKLNIIFNSIVSLAKKKGLSLKRYIRAVTIAEKVNRIILQEKIDFLFTYDNEQLHLIPFIKKSTSKPKIFATIYGAFYLNPDFYFPEKRFLRYAVSRVDRILSCSEYCVDSGKKFLEIDYPTKVFYNNVDEVLYHPSNDGGEIRRRYGIQADSIVLMTMGRVGSDMGVDFLLRIGERISSIAPNIVIFFAGAEAELCDEVIKYARSNEKVRFSFNIPFEEKPLFFAACDIFTAPTKERHACMGIANIEAMMSGKAVISSTSGGHSETIEDNVSGILVPFIDGKLDEDFYIESLSLLVKNRLIRNFLGINGRARALKLFTNEQIVREHLNMLGDY